MTVQSKRDQADQELLALALETDRVADMIPEPAMRLRLKAIASRLRAIASQGVADEDRLA